VPASQATSDPGFRLPNIYAAASSLLDRMDLAERRWMVVDGAINAYKAVIL